ncbi:MAG: DnaA regulatory inactivator Hda [Gammaproteobacteria bacterium]|nr:DnaA regulatory inactivator Hda [Gammaproteobacteria bacterium]
MLPQLPLGLKLRLNVSFDSFVGNANRELLTQLRASAQGTGEPYLYIWGGSGSGKSHLLQAGCHSAQQHQLAAAYIPLREASRLTPEVLQNLSAFDLVCLDDFDRVCGQSHWEQALFNLFNQLRDAGARLLVSADRAAAALPLQLVDLRSRLEWGPGYQLLGLDDVGRAQLLNRSAENRGLELPPETLNYILARAPRDTRSLLELLQRLDRASLAAQRRLTVPFVRRVFEEADY